MGRRQPSLSSFLLVATATLGFWLSLPSPLPRTCLGQPQLHAVYTGDDDRQQLQAYIVHVEKPNHMVFASPEERVDWHRSFLPSATLDSGEPRLIYSYEKSISGFAARLTPAEVEAMEGKDGFLLAHPATPVELRTTRSQHFLRLDDATTSPGGSLWDLTNQGEGMVIGVFDTGIDPTQPSFDDADMPPRPRAWMGRPCRFGNTTYRCNNKVIGAVAFNWKSRTPVADDTTTHGTIIASCAAGSPVRGASYHGLAAGTARGAAPRAYIAVYVAEDTADVLKAYDQAINDGVDVFSVSQGIPGSNPFHRDSFAIGALAAVEGGIFVSAAAGNSGPRPSTVWENAPWTLSVGATSIDRVLKVSIHLGDGSQVLGESLLSPQSASGFPTTPLPLVYPGAGRGASSFVKECTDSTMGGIDVRGKIVLCMASYEGYGNKARVCNAAAAGATAVVLMNQRTSGPFRAEFTIVGNTVCLDFDAARCGVPTVQVNYEESQQLKAYASSALPASATIRFTGTRLGAQPNPRVASFSSRGPSRVNNGVLKPDILGPGHNILGTLPGFSPFHPFVLTSGTSLACPHLSGVVALIKKSHPTWSPAAIRSAIMTTADELDNSGQPITDETDGPANLFATGAGQVNPAKANDPGLVYDIQPNDYTRYVCGLGYTSWEVKAVLRRTVDCNTVGRTSGEQLNYPSLSVSLGGAPKTLSRTVTNVQPVRGIASYTVSVNPIPGVRVDVQPRRLDFQREGQKRSFTVTLSPAPPYGVRGTTADGQIRWVSAQDHHVVRSPIAVSFV